MKSHLKKWGGVYVNALAGFVNLSAIWWGTLPAFSAFLAGGSFVFALCLYWRLKDYEWFMETCEQYNKTIAASQLRVHIAEINAGLRQNPNGETVTQYKPH